MPKIINRGSGWWRERERGTIRLENCTEFDGGNQRKELNRTLIKWVFEFQKQKYHLQKSAEEEATKKRQEQSGTKDSGENDTFFHSFKFA